MLLRTCSYELLAAVDVDRGAQFLAREAAGPARIPAQEIEDLILAELNRLFQSPQQLLALLSEPATDESSRHRLLQAFKSLEK